MLPLPDFSPITAASPQCLPPSLLLLIHPSCCISEPKLTTTKGHKYSFQNSAWAPLSRWEFITPSFIVPIQSPFICLSLSLDKASSPNYTFYCKQTSLLLKHYFHPRLQNSPRESNPEIREAKWLWDMAVKFRLDPCTMTAPASSLRAEVSNSLSKTTDHLFISANKIY